MGGLSLIVLLLLSTQVQAQTADTTTLTQRLDSYKTQLALTQLSRTDESKIKLRCGVAQSTLKNLQTRVATVQTKRGEAYGTIQTDMDKLITRLKDQAFETTTIEGAVDAYDAKIAGYTTTMNAYKQAIDDAVAVDCATNPLGFKVALEVARRAHASLLIGVTDIRSYALNTLKPTLGQVKQQIQSGRTTGGNQ